jgi:hypothetical protein
MVVPVLLPADAADLLQFAAFSPPRKLMLYSRPPRRIQTSRLLDRR